MAEDGGQNTKLRENTVSKVNCFVRMIVAQYGELIQFDPVRGVWVGFAHANEHITG